MVQTLSVQIWCLLEMYTVIITWLDVQGNRGEERCAEPPNQTRALTPKCHRVLCPSGSLWVSFKMGTQRTGDVKQNLSSVCRNVWVHLVLTQRLSLQQLHLLYYTVFWVQTVSWLTIFHNFCCSLFPFLFSWTSRGVTWSPEGIK